MTEQDTEGHMMLTNPTVTREISHAREREIQKNLISRAQREDAKTSKEKKGDGR